MATIGLSARSVSCLYAILFTYFSDISNYFLWDGHPLRPMNWAGKGCKGAPRRELRSKRSVGEERGPTISDNLFVGVP